MSLPSAKYRPLATIAAKIIHGPGTVPSSLVTAIIAHWTCEQPAGAWPPGHDNPGYVSVNALASVNVTAEKATTSPGVGFLASFATPEAGARAYGLLIARAHRYRNALPAAKAGDGAKYLRVVTQAGYGTRETCVLAAFKRLSPAKPKPVAK